MILPEVFPAPSITARQGETEPVKTANFFDWFRGGQGRASEFWEKIPFGTIPIFAAAGLAGVLGHPAGVSEARREAIAAGAAPEDVARASFLAERHEPSYGVFRTIGAASLGSMAGMGTEWALRRGFSAPSWVSRPLGIAAGLASAYEYARERAKYDEKRRLKGL